YTLPAFLLSLSNSSSCFFPALGGSILLIPDAPFGLIAHRGAVARRLMHTVDEALDDRHFLALALRVVRRRLADHDLLLAYDGIAAGALFFHHFAGLGHVVARPAVGAVGD